MTCCLHWAKGVCLFQWCLPGTFKFTFNYRVLLRRKTCPEMMGVRRHLWESGDVRYLTSNLTGKSLFLWKKSAISKGQTCFPPVFREQYWKLIKTCRSDFAVPAVLEVVKSGTCIVHPLNCKWLSLEEKLRYCPSGLKKKINHQLSEGAGSDFPVKAGRCCCGVLQKSVSDRDWGSPLWGAEVRMLLPDLVKFK